MAVKYFEDPSIKGFIAVKKQMVMNLTDANISYQTATDKVTTFDDAFVDQYLPTTTSWTADATGVVTDTSTGYAGYATGTTLTGSTNGLLILETIKNRQIVTFKMKIDASNYQNGSAIITDCSHKYGVGKNATWSLKLQGTGALTKSTT